MSFIKSVLLHLVLLLGLIYYPTLKAQKVEHKSSQKEYQAPKIKAFTVTNAWLKQYQHKSTLSIKEQTVKQLELEAKQLTVLRKKRERELDDAIFDELDNKIKQNKETLASAIIQRKLQREKIEHLKQSEVKKQSAIENKRLADDVNVKENTSKNISKKTKKSDVKPRSTEYQTIKESKEKKDLEYYRNLYAHLIKERIENKRSIDKQGFCALSLMIAKSGYIRHIKQSRGDKVMCDLSKQALYDIQRVPLPLDDDLKAKIKYINIMVQF